MVWLQSAFLAALAAERARSQEAFTVMLSMQL